MAGGFQELAAVLVAEGPRQTAILPRDPGGTCAVNVSLYFVGGDVHRTDF